MSSDDETGSSLKRERADSADDNAEVGTFVDVLRKVKREAEEEHERQERERQEQEAEFLKLHPPPTLKECIARVKVWLKKQALEVARVQRLDCMHVGHSMITSELTIRETHSINKPIRDWCAPHDLSNFRSCVERVYAHVTEQLNLAMGLAIKQVFGTAKIAALAAASDPHHIVYTISW
jgi:hypothetical protein